MDDVVGLRVTLKNGRVRGVITWGRVGDPIDDGWLLDAYRLSLSVESKAEVERVELCGSLREISTSEYFFEGLIAFARRPIPFGEGYEEWRAERLDEFKAGNGDFYDVGESRLR